MRPYHRRLPTEPDIAAVARLLAEPARMAMLEALLGGGTCSGRELAAAAGVAPSTASEATATQLHREARTCDDHLAGSLGAAVAGRLLERRWIARRPGLRAVEVTASGRRGLADWIGVEPDAAGGWVAVAA